MSRLETLADMARPDLLDRQMTELQAVHPSAALADAGDGSHVVSVDLPLATGWNLRCTTVEFVVTAPYPTARPDCFFTDPALRLLQGDMPVNSAMQPLGHLNRLWFSWHLQQPWQPNRHTLLTYVRFIQERLRCAN